MEENQSYMTEFEKKEIEAIGKVYYYNSSVKTSPSSFDDSENYYNTTIHDHIAYQYQITKILGKGSFGQVVSAYDHKAHEYVAMKIIRNEERFTKQAKEEISILEHLTRKASWKSELPIVFMLGNLSFRGHTCISFELLGENLFELIKSKRFVGLQRIYVKRIARNVLHALHHVHSLNIIHCDLKPENILIVPESSLERLYKNENDDPTMPETTKFSVKLIDFGSSVYADRQMYPYIQSRFYRAPEIILRSKYTNKIDIWSFGCLLVELIRGLPLFSGSDEYDQLASIMEVRGIPPKKLLKEGRNSKNYFREIPPTTDVLNPATNEIIKFQPHYLRITEDGGRKILSTSHAKKSGYPRGLPGSMKIKKIINLKKNIIFEGNRMVSQPYDEMRSTSPEMKAFKKRVLEKDTECLVGLVEKCLEWLPENRCSADKAINHAWFQCGRNFFNDPVNSEKHVKAIDKRASRHSIISSDILKLDEESPKNSNINPLILRYRPKDDRIMSDIPEVRNQAKLLFSDNLKKRVRLRNTLRGNTDSMNWENSSIGRSYKNGRYSFDINQPIKTDEIKRNSRLRKPAKLLIGQKNYFSGNYEPQRRSSMVKNSEEKKES